MPRFVLALWCVFVDDLQIARRWVVAPVRAPSCSPRGRASAVRGAGMTDPWAATLLALPVPLDLLVLVLALAIDLLFGEPPSRIHPTVLIGKTISAAEQRAPAADAAPGAQVAYGVAVAGAIPAAWGALAWAVSAGLRELHPLLYLVVAAALFKTTFSVRMLAREAKRIGDLLAAGDLAAARRRMPARVSRETGALTASQAAAGTIESVAENSTDSVVGPLLALALFGLPGAVVYRAVNTLDSMIGYRGCYEYLGKAAARLDDLVNLVPARLAGRAAVVHGGAAAIDACRRGVARRVEPPSPNGVAERRLDDRRHGRRVGHDSREAAPLPDRRTRAAAGQPPHPPSHPGTVQRGAARHGRGRCGDRAGRRHGAGSVAWHPRRTPRGRHAPCTAPSSRAELRKLGLRREDCLDFSASISPLGTPSAVAAAVDLSTYPIRAAWNCAKRSPPITVATG